MSILKLQVITSLFVVLFSGHVLADAVCDECMDQKAKDQTISLNSSVNDVIKVAGEVDPFNRVHMNRLCDSLRYATPSSINRDYYEYEYHLLKLAKVDLENDRMSVRRKKMQDLWKEHSKDFECTFGTATFPKGNYFKQLMHSPADGILRSLLTSYRISPNIIDQVDGCTALDYVNKQINDTVRYTPATREVFKKYKDMLLESGAKSANDLGGKC